MTKFRKVIFYISRTAGYGQYKIHATYKGKQVIAHTTDSECYDYLNDDSNKKKHQNAKRHAYYKIVNAYSNL